jgi:hypothetical protein
LAGRGDGGTVGIAQHLLFCTLELFVACLSRFGLLGSGRETGRAAVFFEQQPVAALHALERRAHRIDAIRTLGLERRAFRQIRLGRVGLTQSQPDKPAEIVDTRIQRP